jgi:acetamidase/formamidase
MHIIEPNEYTVHGYLSRDRQPILTVESGETIRYRTMYDARWKYYDTKTDSLIQSELRVNDPLRGHCLLGPVAVRGAKKGRVLEVQVGEIQPQAKGWNIGAGMPIPGLAERLGVEAPHEHMVEWRIDTRRGTARNPLGHVVRIYPFLGLMGMPPDEPGHHPTAPPRYCGGNIDCKLLVAGSSVFLPIPVDGALFSAGDGHAAQGDGEVSGTAIECPIDQVDLTLVLHPDMSLTTPRARTPEGWITLGFHEDLNEATMIALNAMIDLMCELFAIGRPDAVSLASVVVDLRITQIVNGVQGVHAILPNGAVE